MKKSEKEFPTDLHAQATKKQKNVSIIWWNQIIMKESLSL